MQHSVNVWEQPYSGPQSSVHIHDGGKSEAAGGSQEHKHFKKWEFRRVKAGSASALVGERSFLSRDEALAGRMRHLSLLVLLQCSPGSLLITLGVQEGWLKS